MSVPARPLIADWPLTVCRYFLVDGDAGDDTARGYVDAAPGSTIAPGANPKKTIAAVMAIVPQLGFGRTIAILIKGKAGAASYAEDLVGGGMSGYRLCVIRGSTDLTNSAADRILCGARIAIAGPNGDSSFTCQAGATTTVFSIAAGAIGAEPAAIQYRVRFTAATTTAALRNQCRTISAHTNTQITLTDALTNAPAATDTFVIEGPGVTLTGARFVGSPAGGQDSGILTATGASFAGLRFTSTANEGTAFYGGDFRLSFCEWNGATNNRVLYSANATAFFVAGVYVDETAVAVTTGMGLRTSTAVAISGCLYPTLLQCGFMNATNALLLDIVTTTGRFNNSMSIGDRSYFAKGARISGGSGSVASNGSSGSINIGRGSSSFAQPRFVGAQAGSAGLFLDGGGFSVTAIDFTNMGALAAISINQRGGLPITVQGCTGSTGNTGVGVDFSTCENIVVDAGRFSANTVTGSAGDIKLAGGVIASWAGLAITNLVDRAGNRLLGSPNRTVDQCVEFTNVEGSALTVGALVKVSAAGNVNLAQADTQAHAGGATGLPLFVAVTAPANNALGLFVAVDAPQKWVNFDGAPTQGALAYISVGTGGAATTTIPPLAATNQKLRLGHVAAVSGTRGLVTGTAELFPVLADGLF